MKKIAIVTDSMANIPLEMALKLGIQVIPYHIVLDGRTYLEGKDITFENFYKRYDLYHVKKVEDPKEHDYTIFYMKLAKVFSSMVLLHSSKSPGNLFATASKVHEKMRYEHNCKVACVDCATLGSGQGLLAVLAAQAAGQGQSMHQVLRLLYRAIEASRVYVHPGAVRGVKKLPGGGGLFRSTPILTDGAKEGWAPAEKIKIKKGRFLLDMVKHVQKDIAGQPVYLAVTSPDVDALYERILPPFEESLDCRVTMSGPTCPSVAVDLGPQVIQVAYIKYGGLEKYFKPRNKIAA